jgi:hypothetical protein
MRIPLAAQAVATLLLLAGCAVQPPQGENWWKLEPASFSFLVPGKTPREEVERNVGMPLLITNFERQREQVWDYRYKDGTYVYVNELHFDESGVLKYAVNYPDRCVMRPVPCR